MGSLDHFRIARNRLGHRLQIYRRLTKFWPSVFTILAVIASMGLLAIATRDLPIGTAYAVWVGIGALGTVILGIVLFNEPRILAACSSSGCS